MRYKSSVEAVNFVHVCLQSAIITIYRSGTIRNERLLFIYLLLRLWNRNFSWTCNVPIAAKVWNQPGYSIRIIFHREFDCLGSLVSSTVFN